MRGATRTLPEMGRAKPYFNPRTPCGVRPDYYNRIADENLISIHAPHAGCDERGQHCGAQQNISIHAPHAGCDIRLCHQLSPHGHFNPRTPCGVRHAECKSDCDGENISIHAPHAGCDNGLLILDGRKFRFQSTHPMRGATGVITTNFI